MDHLTEKLRHLSARASISSIAFVLISLFFGLLLWGVVYTVSGLLEKRAIDDLTVKTRTVIDMLDVFNSDLQREAGRSIKILEGNFPGKFSLDTSSKVDVAGKSTPSLRNGGATVNLDFAVVDRFSSRSGISATVFVRAGDDFVRVSTSLRNEKGERAIGTPLDRAHPGYALLMAGKSYSGVATLFGKKFFTQYNPIKDDGGQIIGALYIGIDFTNEIKSVKDRINALTVGETGYFYALDAREGKGMGDLVIHGKREGQNVLAEKTADEREYVKEILSQKNGSMRYRSKGEESGASARERMIAFSYFKDWNWVVVGGTYTAEITGEVTKLSYLFAGVGLVGVAILVFLVHLLIRNRLTRPLQQATEVAQRIAQGDLTGRVETNRTDVVGQLLTAINGIGQGLANLVWSVRHATDTIAAATQEISSGNHDLSSRTEQQASSLEETASSMEELTSTVRQNADNAQQANQQAFAASDVAVKSGSVVSQAVETMHAIHESSKKIADIINVIDSIAFQTNILALNAAVEAARAGEQGRGFAVVATEVRSLAQRSAAAAREIKVLIDDSVAKVDVGNKLVEQAGATMGDVVNSVKRVTDIMGEISAASSEQSNGIDQINQAVTQMDTVTQQNAALVEQAAAAAESLQGQAAELVKLVGSFTLKTNAYGTKDEAFDAVQRVLVSLRKNGRERTFAEVNKPNGVYTDRDLYVVVYDLHGRNVAHGAFPAMVGKDLIDAKDGAGKFYVRERLDIINKFGKGWQDYTFTNPVTKQMEPKSMYLEKFEDVIIGCGAYNK
ncbi:MAG: tar2 [Burkholderiaceae bacterium]|nr:tar2 [Burkholderiaceae bacterium]